MSQNLEPPFDFEGAALDLEAAADGMRPYIDRLRGLIRLIEVKGGFSMDFPDEFLISIEDMYRAHQSGERAFFRYIDFYPLLRSEWIQGTLHQFKMTLTEGHLQVMQEKVEVLDKCSRIVRQRGKLAPRKDDYRPQFTNYFGGVHMGDVFQGISNSTIISRSIVENAFNRLQESGDTEAAALMLKIGNTVSASESVAAGAVYSQMAQEVAKPEQDKSVIKDCWDGLVKILPSLAELSAAVIKAFMPN